MVTLRLAPCYMLEPLSIRRYVRDFRSYDPKSRRKNPLGADNQQETEPLILDHVFRSEVDVWDPQRLHARRLLSELVQQTVEDIVRAAWRHAEISRNGWSADAKISLAI